jgi:hypothetical protein
VPGGRVSVDAVDLGSADDLVTAVHELRDLVAVQAGQIADLRAELAAVTRQARPPVPAEPLVTGRRRFLALAAGGAVAAAAAATVAGASPVAAANGDAVEISQTTVASAGAMVTTVLDYSLPTAAQIDYLRVTDKNVAVVSLDPFYAKHVPAAVAGHARLASTRAITGVTGLSEVEGGNGVLGIGTGTGGSYGVWGISESGNGVVGRSFAGYDFFGEGAGRIGLSAHVFVGPPLTGTYTAGDILRDSQGALWTCVVTGAPGLFRKLAGPTTAGALHTVTPTRAYDSRWQRPNSGLLATGQARTISVADGRRTSNGDVVTADLVPEGATAIACNITITDTFGSGYAVVNPGQDFSVGASTINWSHSDQTLANGIIVGIDDERRVTLVVGGGGVTNIVVDITGYFR